MSGGVSAWPCREGGDQVAAPFPTRLCFRHHMGRARLLHSVQPTSPSLRAPCPTDPLRLHPALVPSSFLCDGLLPKLGEGARPNGWGQLDGPRAPIGRKVGITVHYPLGGQVRRQSVFPSGQPEAVGERPDDLHIAPPRGFPGVGHHKTVIILTIHDP